MTTSKKGTTTPRKKSPASAAKAPARPRKGPKTIRNLRELVVHGRLYSKSQKDPFRIALEPRGKLGDITVIPTDLTDDPTFLKGIDILWEVITQSEARAIEANYGPVGYLGREDAPQIIRDADTTISTADDWDGKGRRAPVDRNLQIKERGSEGHDREFGTGMHTADVPGADHGLHAQLSAAQKAAEAMGEEATPEGVDVTSRRVVIERVKGQ